MKYVAVDLLLIGKKNKEIQKNKNSCQEYESVLFCVGNAEQVFSKLKIK